jgi:hypothetical protein
MRPSCGALMPGLPPVLLAATLGFATTLILAGPLRAEGGATEIVFASGSDDTGTVSTSPTVERST